MYYRLIDYTDVYKDENDMWIVNNQCVIDENIYISNFTDADLIQWMKDWNYLTNTTTIEDLDIYWDEDFIEIIQNYNSEPLYRFERKN